MTFQGNTEAPDQRAVTPASQPAGRERIFHFEDGDETITVKTIEYPNGECIAFDVNDPQLVIGHGFSTIGATADLFKKLPAARSEREERDYLAERFDHQRDLRKHEAVT